MEAKAEKEVLDEMTKEAQEEEKAKLLRFVHDYSTCTNTYYRVLVYAHAL